MARTKIVCTVGPASRSEAVLERLVRAGMNVARINCSHGDHSEHAEVLARLRAIAAREVALVVTMADLQGPKVRVGRLGQAGMLLRPADAVELASTPVQTAEHQIPVPHPEVVSSLTAGQRVLLDDGKLELVVREARDGHVTAVVVTGGQLTSSKGVNLPGAVLPTPAMTSKDRDDALFAIGQGVDLFAMSFVRAADDVEELRSFLREHGTSPFVISKIENAQAVANFDEILEASDGIMVARGDLGVEMLAEEVPFHQKHIVKLCNRIGKPVIIATQMLQSMIENSRPTRAESSDVANAILDGADALLLSGETAIGSYPVEAVSVMNSLSVHAELHMGPSSLAWAGETDLGVVTGPISHAAVEIARSVGAKAIVTATMSGLTARMVARYRPGVPVLAVTPSERTCAQLAIVWGVQPVLVPRFQTTDEMVRVMADAVMETGLAQLGDLIVLTGGVPFGRKQRTNLLKVHVVGE
jgi:pyruvate kinase